MKKGRFVRGIRHFAEAPFETSRSRKLGRRGLMAAQHLDKDGELTRDNEKKKGQSRVKVQFDFGLPNIATLKDSSRFLYQLREWARDVFRRSRDPVMISQSHSQRLTLAVETNSSNRNVIVVI